MSLLRPPLKNPATKSVLVMHRLNWATQNREINKVIRKMTKRGWVYTGQEHTYGGIRVMFSNPSVVPRRTRR